MNVQFNIRRRTLRAELHKQRVADRDTSTERLMADAFTLDETLRSEFGSINRESGWCYNTGGGAKVAVTQAKRFRTAGAYVGLGEGAK
ncbi:MAG: hypothetical protein RL651_1212 [Pseudomonadota bacterium]|jgi:hypothetical protein